MAVAVDYSSNSGTANAVSSKSWSHTVSGANRLLLVAVEWNQPNNTETVSNVSYDGVALTQVGPTVVAGGSGLDRCTALYRLVAPSTGTKTIAVTMSTSLTFFAGAVSFTGVNQTTPLGTPQTASSTNSASISTTVSSASTNLVFSGASIRATSALTTPSTQQWNALIGSNNRYGGAVQPGATSVVSTYSWTTADNAALIAVDVKASSSVALPARASITTGSKMSGISDDFTTADTTKWQAVGGGGFPSGITVVSGRLNIALSSTYREIESVSQRDLRNDFAMIEIVQRPEQDEDHSTEMAFGVRLDANNSYQALLTGTGYIGWRTMSGGTAGTSGYTTYDPSTMRWLRWRNSGTTVYLEASPTVSGPWTALVTYPVTFSLATMRAFLYAGYYGTQTTPGTAIYDNYNVAPTKSISATARIVNGGARVLAARARIIGGSSFSLGGLAFPAVPSKPIQAQSRIAGNRANTVSGRAKIVQSAAPIDTSGRPKVSPAAEEMYARLGHAFTYADERLGWPLLRLVDALTRALQRTEDLVRDNDDGPGWSPIMDLERAPDDALPWLAQLIGVDVNPDLAPDAQRLRIRETAGFQRGTVKALEGAAKQYLTGSRTVVIDERDTSPYHLTVTTFLTETPLPDKTQDALMAQKPAGLVLEFVVSSGASCGALKATGMTCAQLDSTYATPKAMKLAVLV